MRIIYTDEAGTSAREPVRVVAALIVHGDDQLRGLIREHHRLIKSMVPTKYQSNFIFHGLEIFNGGKTIDRKVWKFEDRLQYFMEVIKLPISNDIPIALGVAFAGSYSLIDSSDMPVPYHQFEHLSAFSSCMERADLFLRKYLNNSEVGMVVAEDTTEMKRILSAVGMAYRENPFTMEAQDLRPSARQKALGISPTAATYEIRNLVDVPHFVPKNGAPLLQLADACAFGFRRCLARQPHGDDLVQAMLGPLQAPGFINDEVWYSETSSGLFNTQKYWNDDRKYKNFDQKIREFSTKGKFS